MGVPAMLIPITACPWPVTTTEGIQYCRAAASVAALSNTVPDCTTVGVVVRFWNSYQRVAFRAAATVLATPVASTRKLWAAHSRPLRTMAWKNRSSRESSRPLLPPVLPRWVTGLGLVVVDTETTMLAEIVGVRPPGLLTRRNVMAPKTALSGPTKYPSVAPGSKLSTPRGDSGPVPAPAARLANMVTVSGPAARADTLPTTSPLVPTTLPVLENMLQPM